MRCLNCRRDGIPVAATTCPNCGVHLPSLLRDVLPTGTILRGTYKIEYALGRGGFGITYRAHHKSLDHQVAIKEFFPQEQVFRDGATGGLSVATAHRGSYQRALERFMREGRILARLDHPNVVRVRDAFEERGTAYLVMDLLAGRTLGDELEAHAGRRLPPKRVKEIAEQLVAALEAVHRQNVFHLDIKPDNILLMPDNQAVLVDFGAARQGLTSKSTQAFTMEYAAPEVLAGHEVGPESDLFELGMVLHEMLTGARPPSALSRLMEGDWQPRGMDEAWRGLLRAVLHMRKEQRPANVREWWGGHREGRKSQPQERRDQPEGDAQSTRKAGSVPEQKPPPRFDPRFAREQFSRPKIETKPDPPVDTNPKVVGADQPASPKPSGTTEPNVSKPLTDSAVTNALSTGARVGIFLFGILLFGAGIFMGNLEENRFIAGLPAALAIIFGIVFVITSLSKASEKANF